MYVDGNQCPANADCEGLHVDCYCFFHFDNRFMVCYHDLVFFIDYFNAEYVFFEYSWDVVTTD